VVKLLSLHGVLRPMFESSHIAEELPKNISAGCKRATRDAEASVRGHNDDEKGKEKEFESKTVGTSTLVTFNVLDISSSS
jgi:hypothetical protein